MHLGIRGKFLLPTLLLIFLGTSLTAWTSFFNSRAIIIDTTTRQLQQQAASMRECVSSWVENRKQDVSLWSQQGAVSTTLGMYRADAESGSFIMVAEVLDNLKASVKSHPYYEEIGVATVAGLVLTHSNIEKVTVDTINGKNIRDREFFQQALKGELVVTDVRASELSNRPVFIIAAPVPESTREENSAVNGVLYAVVDLPCFTEKFIKPVQIGDEGFVYICDRTGRVIAHPDDSKNLNMNISGQDFGAAMLARESGVVQYSLDGREQKAAFCRDETLGWTVAAVASLQELLAPVRSLLWTNALITLVVLLIACGVIVWVAAWVSRPITNITGSLEQVARQVSGAADQISQSSQLLAQGASSQASSIEETSASLEELASMANHNADNSQQANNLSDEARHSATGGAEVMDTLVQVMEGINESSQEVAKVAKGIEEIAFQTNLLALNAAVEAARAGEAGKGFAVVAEEVRNLAQRASEQARVTSRLITESRSRTEGGSTQAADANAALKQILVSVEKVGSLVGEITAASKEQAQGIDQINRAVSSMDQVVQQNSASSEESAAASEELSGQATEMKALVRTLSLLVSGEHDASDDNTVRRTASTPRPAKPAAAAPKPEQRPLPPAGKKTARQRPEEIIPFDDDDFSDF